MKTLKIDISKVLGFVPKEDIYKFQKEIDRHHKSILEKTGKGNDFLGWVDLPGEIDESLVSSILDSAQKIRKKNIDVFIVIGIGGSYLGARAVIEALNHNFSFLLNKGDSPQIIYAGQNIGEDYLSDLLEVLEEKDYALTVISKSGTTTEPALAFRILKTHLENKYGKPEAKERIIVITDESKGALKQLAREEGYTTYVVPDDVGGRYSVLTPVGLLPIAVAGFDIRSLLAGAKKMQTLNKQGSSLDENPMAMYAAVRNALLKSGKVVEILVNYQPSLFYLTEWWKQLFGESEGKEGKGIFPAGVGFTTDLHSMGQYIQEGYRMIFETVLAVGKAKKKLKVPMDDANLDGLNYLAGKRIHDVNKMAELGTALAHIDGGVPNIGIIVPEVNEETIGELIYFFEMSCALSGYTLGVNPFNQPGVEAYKKNMFALLGKPGFESETEAIRKKI